ncbi:MAG: ABC transporter permease [Chloroflexota bacterium]|jgi:ABC-2 type transport system permease protein
MVNNTINPILLRELRGRMRTARSFWLLSGFLVMVAGAALLIYTSTYSESPGQFGGDSDIGRSVFLMLMVTTMVALSFVAPVLAAGSIAGERERQTFDLLLTTQLPMRQIVFGKIIASLSYCLLLLAAITPLMGIVFLIGSVDLAQLVIMLLVVFSNIVLLTCIGVYWSARATTPLSATGMTLASVLFILLAIPLLVLTLPEIIFTASVDQYREFINHVTLAIHPFIVLFYTDDALRTQQVWGQAFSLNGATIVMPAMWILSIMYAWILSTIIVWRTLRRMHKSL